MKTEEYRPYDRIEVDLKDINSDQFITYKGYFIRYTKSNKALIQVNSVHLEVDINRIRKVSNE